jgi:hypothetical protein
MPWGIALKVEAAVLVRLLLEKAHLLFVPNVARPNVRVVGG